MKASTRCALWLSLAVLPLRPLSGVRHRETIELEGDDVLI